MKKFFLILAVVSIVVLDLILSGESVILGLILLSGAGLASYGLDQAQRASKCSNNAQKYVSKQVSATFSA